MSARPTAPSWPSWRRAVNEPGRGPFVVYSELRDVEIITPPISRREGGSLMTGVRRRIAQGLVATIVLCALAFMVCGSFASPGNVYERACVGLVVAMLGALVAAISLAAGTFLGLRADVKRHLRRPILTDEEFLTRLPAGPAVELERVAQIRELAAHCFRRLGGAHFEPEDRLEEDLHLSDLAPFKVRSFFAALEQGLGLDEGSLRGRFAGREFATFGDVIVTAAGLAEAVRPPTEEIRPT